MITRLFRSGAEGKTARKRKRLAVADQELVTELLFEAGKITASEKTERNKIKKKGKQ